MKNVFYKIVILTFLLSGCAKESNPITDINNDIQQGVTELVDYANNNMEMDADKQLLLQGAKDCAAKADALTKTSQAVVSKCEAEVSKAKTERNALALALVGIMALFLFRRRFL